MADGDDGWPGRVTTEQVRAKQTTAHAETCAHIFRLHTQWREGPEGDPALDAFASLYSELGEPIVLDSLIALARGLARANEAPTRQWRQ